MDIWSWYFPDGGGGFGDRWANINFILQQDKVNLFSALSPRLKEAIDISSCLDTENKLHFINCLANKRPGLCESFQVEFLPTIRKWNPKKKIVTYQFDGRSNNNRKSLSPEEISFILRGLRALGYKPINVGKMKPLPVAIELMSQSKFFVGVCSGMSHVAKSVKGLPVYVIYNNMDYNAEKNCQYANGGILIHTFREFFKTIASKQRLREYNLCKWAVENKINNRWDVTARIDF